MFIGAFAMIPILFYMPRSTKTVKNFTRWNKLLLVVCLSLVALSAFYSAFSFSRPQISEVSLNIGWSLTIIWGVIFHSFKYIKK